MNINWLWHNITLFYLQLHSRKNMKRSESRKSYSWWWDSHISPKNSKWLTENLEDMDQSVKRMLKLIEEDGDSFAKKAEMYYQKRPELISLVEEFYRIYRSLAERCDILSIELRKNIPSDLQSQGSGISDIGSELPSMWPSSEQRLSRRKSGPRAAGFDFFLGSAGNSSDVYQKGDESSSLTDSEPESDDSSVNNYPGLIGNGGDQGLNRKIIELEIELREVKDKLRVQEEGNADGSLRRAKSENFLDLDAKIGAYEHELKIANEKIQISEKEIAMLKIDLQKYNSSEITSGVKAEFESSEEEDVKTREAELGIEISQASELQETCGLESETQDPDSKIQALVEELKITKQRLSEEEIASSKHELESNESTEKINSLQEQLELSQKDVAMWKTKLSTEKREVSKLQGSIARLKTSLSDRDHEVRDLKLAVSDAEEKIFPEKAWIKAEISELLEARIRFNEQLREWESRGRSLEDEIRTIRNEKTEMEEKLNGEIEHLKAEIVERGNRIDDLNENIHALKLERDKLNVEILSVKAALSSRDDRIDEMDQHLQQLHMEHVELITSVAGARKLINELRSNAKELQQEVERQRIVILEGAEEKREVIRQLCFSLEHYRNGYHRLRQAFIGHNKGFPVYAS